MKTLKRLSCSSSSLVAGLALALGCSQAPEDEDVDFIESSVEEENGGLDMEDEAPMFGDEALFAELDLTDVESNISDEFASDPEVLAITEAPDAVIDHVVIMWGGGERPRDWSGSIVVSDGVMLAARAIRFDERDSIAPRTDRRRVDFRSHTLKHRDGLRLLLAAKADGAAGRTLTYGVDGNRYTVDLDALLDNPQVREVGDAGDRIAIVAHRRPVDLCESGFLRGQWLQMGRGYGALRARVSNADGDNVGHLRGVYGVRGNGNRVFFGKFINRAGQFKGIFAGRYRSGRFVGRWLARGGEHGKLGGLYRESRAGVRHGGGLIGRWAETSCNSRISDVISD